MPHEPTLEQAELDKKEFSDIIIAFKKIFSESRLQGLDAKMPLREILLLLLRIVDHDIKYGAIETLESRRETLFAISFVVAMLPDSSKSPGEDNTFRKRYTNADGRSVWRDLEFFSKTDVMPERWREPGYKVFHVTDERVKNILENDVQTLKTLLEMEINSISNSYKKEQAYLYSHDSFKHIFEIVNYYRDLDSVSKALEAILILRSVDIKTINGILAFAKALEIIGENLTKKSLTKYGRSINPALDYNLLIDLRNRFAHLEWYLPGSINLEMLALEILVELDVVDISKAVDMLNLHLHLIITQLSGLALVPDILDDRVSDFYRNRELYTEVQCIEWSKHSLGEMRSLSERLNSISKEKEYEEYNKHRNQKGFLYINESLVSIKNAIEILETLFKEVDFTFDQLETSFAENMQEVSVTNICDVVQDQELIAQIQELNTLLNKANHIPFRRLDNSGLPVLQKDEIAYAVKERLNFEKLAKNLRENKTLALAIEFVTTSIRPYLAELPAEYLLGLHHNILRQLIGFRNVGKHGSVYLDTSDTPELTPYFTLRYVSILIKDLWPQLQRILDAADKKVVVLESDVNPLWYDDQQIRALLQHGLQGDHYTIIDGTVFNNRDLLETNTIAAINEALAGQTVVMPINLNGNHWVGAVILNDGNNNLRVIYNDPLGHRMDGIPNAVAFRNVVQRIVAEIGRTVHFTDLAIQQQNNGDDCGTFTADNLIQLAVHAEYGNTDEELILLLTRSAEMNADQLRLQHNDVLRDHAIHVEAVAGNLLIAQELFEQEVITTAAQQNLDEILVNYSERVERETITILREEDREWISVLTAYYDQLRLIGSPEEDIGSLFGV